MKTIVIKKINEALVQTGISTVYENIEPDTILLETDLDSLGFAILVTLLEEELDYDPFQLMEEPVYPKTFGEFVEIYERYNAM